MRYVQEYANYQRLQGLEIERKQRQVVSKKKELEQTRKAKENLLKQGETEKAKLEIQEKDRQTLLANLKKKQKGIQNEISKKKRSAQQLNAQIDRLIEIEIEKARKRAEEEARRKAAAEAAARKAAAAKAAEANKKSSGETASTSKSGVKTSGKKVAPVEKFNLNNEDHRLSGNFERNRGISVALARRMERAGADAVVAEGCESGGHIGETTTMALVPQVADAVKIPVIAAGGIADGRGMAAAFMLGAEAVQMGTRFVASKEAVVHENYKQLVIKAKDIDTRVTGRTTGHPVRAIRNEMTRHYLELEKEGAPFEELEKLTLGGLRRAVVDGDVKTGSVMSGQIAGMVKDEKSCKEIIEQMMKEMEELLKGAPARL